MTSKLTTTTPSAGQGTVLCMCCGLSLKKILKCSRCKLAVYCSTLCQRKHWNDGHKNECIKMCKRCAQPFDPNGECRVPHPIHLRQDQGGMYGQKQEQYWSCNACGGSWTELRERDEVTKEWKDVQIVGQKYCFVGSHTLKRIPKNDERVRKPGSVDLFCTAELQSQLDALPHDGSRVIRRLTVNSGQYYEDSIKFSFTHNLKKLKVLHLIDVCFTTVHLSGDTVPHLAELVLQNISGECDMDIRCPSLKDVKVLYYTAWDGEEDEEGEYEEQEKPTRLKVKDPIHQMLITATKLVHFQSYKLWVYEPLCFASNCLKTIKVHRSDSVGALSVWSPVLEQLEVTACYADIDIQILDDHPLKSEMSKEKMDQLLSSQKIAVNIECSITPSLQYLENHSRVGEIQHDQDETNDIMAQMMAMGQFGHPR